MDSQLIKSLIAALAASDLAELEYTHNGETLRLTRRAGDRPAGAAPAAPAPAPPPAPGRAAPGPSAPQPPPQAAPAAGATDIGSPLYGVVHLRPMPDAAPFVVPGQAVSAGQTLCVIEAMKMFNELRADRDGTVRAILVESGQEVDIGQPLFRLD